MPSVFAIADTCFLVDWARYRRRDVLFKLFTSVFVPEEVLNEVKSENTIAWISEELRRDKLALYTVTSAEVEEARKLIERSRLIPQISSIELPEALCLVVGRSRGYVVLTENRGALLAPRFINEYAGVEVWRALEVLLNAILNGAVEADCDDPGRAFREYSDDTLHIFPARALKRAIEEVERLCMTRS